MPDPSLDHVREALARHDEHLAPSAGRPPSDGPDGVRAGEDAAVAGQGDVDPDAVRAARERLGQADGGH